MAYAVREFNRANLVELLETSSVARQDYFFGYLGHFNCKTILVEESYIDRDYLSDYVRYYSRCFLDYPRRCKRIHFFAEPFDTADFDGCLVQSNPADKSLVKKLQKNYLGFIVVKPLPSTKIGRTCLAVFKDRGFPRKFPAIRDYQVNLFGLTFHVDSLAFQEQDNEVAACATTAVWVAMQKTSELFDTELFSPADITTHAVNSDHEGRIMPSTGLQAYQMCQSFRRMGLEVECLPVNPTEPKELKSFIYSYLHYGIPVILGFEIPSLNARHAVTLTGFSMGKKPKHFTQPTEFISDQLAKVYVHDDQLGPFSRFGLAKTESSVLADHWGAGSPSPVVIAIVPVYNKIRLPWSMIKHQKIEHVDAFLKVILEQLSQQSILTCNSLCWDLYLTDVRELKSSALKNKDFHPFRKEFLTTSFPKFLWRADLYIGFNGGRAKLGLSLMFDATALKQESSNLFAACLFDQTLFDVLSYTSAFAGSSQFLTLLGEKFTTFTADGEPTHWEDTEHKLHFFKGF